MPVLERAGCAALRREPGGRRAAVPAAVKAVGLPTAGCLGAKTPCCAAGAGCCACCWWFSCIGSKAAAPAPSGAGAAGMAAAAAAAAAAPAAPQPACAGCCGDTLCERERGRMRAAGLPAAAAVPNTNGPAAACCSAAAAEEGRDAFAAGPAAVLPSDAAEGWAPNCEASEAAAGAAAAGAKARGLALATPGLLVGDCCLKAARPACALGADAAAPNTKLNGAAACCPAPGSGSPWEAAGGCTAAPWCGGAALPRPSRFSRA